MECRYDLGDVMAQVVVSGQFVNPIFSLPFQSGGISFVPNELTATPDLLGEESLNVDISLRKKSKRKGTTKYSDHCFTDPVLAMTSFKGVLYIYTSNDTAGKIYQGQENVHPTSASETGCFAVSQGRLFFTNGVDTPIHSSDGETWSEVTPPVDWDNGNNPRYFYSQPVGASTQLWAFGCSVNSATSHILYAPSASDNTDFSDGEDHVFLMHIGNVGEDIVGLKVFGNALLAFSKERSYIVNITDVSRSNWTYLPASWRGGATAHNLIVAAKNDIIVFNGLDFYSVAAVETVAEYRMASLSYGVQLNRFIEENIPYVNRARGFSVYDETNNALMFFMRGTKNSAETTYALVLYADTLEWTLYEGMNMPCSAYSYTDPIYGNIVLLGGRDGYIRKLGVGYTDDGNEYDCIIATRHLQVNDKVYSKHFLTISLYLLATSMAGTHGLDVLFDGVFAFSETFTTSLSGFIIAPAGKGGNSTFDLLVPPRKFYMVDMDLSFSGHTVKFVFRPDKTSGKFDMSGLDVYYQGYGATSDMPSDKQ